MKPTDTGVALTELPHKTEPQPSASFRKRVTVGSLIKVCCLLGIGWSCTGAAALAVPNGVAVQKERLAKYAFVRTTNDASAVGLLMGNTELGGLADVAGLRIPTLWGADLWSNDGTRMAVAGPGLACDEFSGRGQPASYRQELGLVDGVLHTRAVYADGSGYEADLFCSMANRHLMVLRVKNLGGTATRTWRMVRPLNGYTVTNPAPGIIMGKAENPGYSHDAWAIRVSKAWTTDAAGHEIVKLAPGETVLLVYSCTTQWDGAEYVKQGEKTVADAQVYKRLVAAQRDAWAALWRQAAVLEIPDPALERLWYRSLFWTLCTCGSEHFLPGESMFVVDAWGMHPFTVGEAGWGIQAYTAAGFPARAKVMLEWFFKPEALRAAAEYYTQVLAGKPALSDAWSFGHELKADMRRQPCGGFELQRHLDGFGAAMFYRFNRYYPDATFEQEKVYPVLRGTARFWQGLSRRDEKTGEYILPQMTSLTENLSATNPIDAALAAKWCLLEAADVAKKLHRDADWATAWQTLAGQLCIPQNTDRYLEYFGDQEQRPGGGYQGVRGFAYLGYPTVELKPLLDRAKVDRTLDSAWIRNREGEGMISFIANWFALADTTWGRGDHALTVMRHNLKCLDKWDTGLSETPGSAVYYFATGYVSYILVPLSMAVQSSDNRIEVFPSVPAAWRDFAFYNVPAEDGLRVSGEMKDGKVRWVSYRKGGKELLRLSSPAVVHIHRNGNTIGLTVQP